MPDKPSTPSPESLHAMLALGISKLETEIRASAAASIAGGMIAATGRPHSVEEAVKLWHRVHYAIDRRYQQSSMNRELAEREHPLDRKHE